MRNSLEPMGMGVVGTAVTSTERTAETGVVGIAETGAMGVARAVAGGISMSTTTPGPSKVSTTYGNRHTN